MLFGLPVVLTTLLSLAAVVVAIPTDLGRLFGNGPSTTGRNCGSHLTLEVVSKIEAAFASLLAENEGANRESPASGTFTIPVNFHVVYASQAASDGYVS